MSCPRIVNYYQFEKALLYLWPDRRVFQHPAKDKYIYRNIFNKRRSHVVPKSTLGWVVRLINNPPAILVKRIQRLLPKYFRHTEIIFTAICNSDALAKATIVLEKQPDSPLKQRLFAAFFASVEPYRVKLPFKLMVLHDPKLTKKEFKAHLVHFAAWWTMLCKGILELDSTIQDKPHPENTLTIEPGDENLYIYNIIEILFLAPKKNMKAEAFLGISHWWPIPETLQKTVPAHDIVYRIVEHLMSLSLRELALAHDMVLTANYLTMKRASR